MMGGFLYAAHRVKLENFEKAEAIISQPPASLNAVP